MIKEHPPEDSPMPPLEAFGLQGTKPSPGEYLKPTPEKVATPSIFLDAAQIIAGPRRQSYGPVRESFENIADVWNVILRRQLGTPITPQQVALMMIGLKLVREANQPGRDNRVDLCGYTGLLDHMESLPAVEIERALASAAAVLMGKQQ